MYLRSVSVLVVCLLALTVGLVTAAHVFDSGETLHADNLVKDQVVSSAQMRDHADCPEPILPPPAIRRHSSLVQIQQQNATTRLEKIYGVGAPRNSHIDVFLEGIRLWAAYEAAHNLTDYAVCCGSELAARRHPYEVVPPYDDDIDLYIGRATAKHLMDKTWSDPAIIPTSELKSRGGELDKAGIHIVLSEFYGNGSSTRYSCQGDVVETQMDLCSFVASPKQKLLGRVVLNAEADAARSLTGEAKIMDLWVYTGASDAEGFESGAPAPLPPTEQFDFGGIPFQRIRASADFAPTLEMLYGKDWMKPSQLWRAGKWVDGTVPDHVY